MFAEVEALIIRLAGVMYLALVMKVKLLTSPSLNLPASYTVVCHRILTACDYSEFFTVLLLMWCSHHVSDLSLDLDVRGIVYHSMISVPSTILSVFSWSFP